MVLHEIGQEINKLVKAKTISKMKISCYSVYLLQPGFDDDGLYSESRGSYIIIGIVI